MKTAQQSQKNAITYTLTRKKVKNINLRVKRDGSVVVSAPMGCSALQIDKFVTEKENWIKQAQKRAQQAQPQDIVVSEKDKQAALALFTAVSNKVFPLFSAILQETPPNIKVRNMKTRWGVCKMSAKQITFSLQLYYKPIEAIEYVVLHEYAHFIVPNHSKDFWAVVEKYMPDYKARRALLKQ